MFERFTKAARQVVLDAVTEAEQERARSITPEHLLLALLRDATRSAPLLATAGLTRDVIRQEFAAAHRQAGLTPAEAEALTHLGIDLTAIVSQIEAAHGPNALATPRRRHSGHTPFAPEAKSVLTGALAQAREHGARHISDEHFLLALAATPTSLPAQILSAHGLTYRAIRTHLAQAS